MPHDSTTHASDTPTLAVIGGTGKEGNAIAYRFAKAGVHVIIGSRDAIRAQKAASDMNARITPPRVDGASNRDAAEKADVVLLSVPYDGMRPILEDLRDAVRNKIVISVVSSLDPERKSRAKPPAAGSVTAEVQQFFGDTAKVVCAFQHVSPEALESLEEKIDTDVIVCGGDKAARETVIAARSAIESDMVPLLTLTASASVRRRRPAQVGQGFWLMNAINRSRTDSLSVSVERRFRCGSTPSHSKSSEAPGASLPHMSPSRIFAGNFS